MLQMSLDKAVAARSLERLEREHRLDGSIAVADVVLSEYLPMQYPLHEMQSGDWPSGLRSARAK